MLKKYSKAILISILIFLFAIRFVGLETSPPGFFVDEAGCAAHVLCLEKFGKNCDGVSWPFYSSMWGYGRVGPVYQYSALIWVKLFGGSIYSLRALSALFGVMSILLLTILAVRISNKNIAFWTMFSALLSPWSFHSSRISWDPAFAPFMLLMALTIFCYASDSKKTFLMLVLSGIFTVATFHTYSNVGVQLFIILFFLFCLQNYIKIISFKNWIIYGMIVCLLFSSILIVDLSLIYGRASELSIFGNDPRNISANLGIYNRLEHFVDNIFLHFGVNYIGISGETNLRHTVKNFGLLSWTDIFGIMMFVIFVLVGSLSSKFKVFFNKNSFHFIPFLIGFLGYLAAVMSSSLTWDSIPHALRSVGGWPFLCLMSGTILSCVNKYMINLFFTGIISFTFLLRFYIFYFNDFREHARPWFDKDVYTELSLSLAKGDRERWDKYMKNRGYPAKAKRYFDLAYFKDEKTKK